jgi:small-conductance mechanosensitive channel
MKKIILTCAAFSFFAATLVSCGETKTETPAETTTATEPATTEPSTAAAPAPTSDAPTFSSEDVNKGLAEYKTLMGDYVKALESKDQAKIAELSTKAQEISKNAAAWSQKLKPEEMKQFSDYWTKLSTEWAAAAQAAVK